MFKIALTAAGLSMMAGIASASLPPNTNAEHSGFMLLAYDQDGTGHKVAVGSEGSNYDQDGTGVAAVSEGSNGVEVAGEQEGTGSVDVASNVEGSGQTAG